MLLGLMILPLLLVGESRCPQCPGVDHAGAWWTLGSFRALRPDWKDDLHC